MVGGAAMDRNFDFLCVYAFYCTLDGYMRFRNITSIQLLRRKARSELQGLQRPNAIQDIGDFPLFLTFL